MYYVKPDPAHTVSSTKERMGGGRACNYQNQAELPASTKYSNMHCACLVGLLTTKLPLLYSVSSTTIRSFGSSICWKRRNYKNWQTFWRLQGSLTFVEISYHELFDIFQGWQTYSVAWLSQIVSSYEIDILDRKTLKPWWHWCTSHVSSCTWPDVLFSKIPPTLQAPMEVTCSSSPAPVLMRSLVLYIVTIRASVVSQCPFLLVALSSYSTTAGQNLIWLVGVSLIPRPRVGVRQDYCLELGTILSSHSSNSLSIKNNNNNSYL